MSWHLVIGLILLGFLGWLTWKLSYERSVISTEDAERILLTIGILGVQAIVLAAAHFLDSKIPAAVALLATLGGILLIGVIWVPRMGRAFLDPLTSAFDGGDESVEAKPFYHRATAYRKQGKYVEAVDEIRAQLEAFPNNAEGMMMLAEVQSDDLKDIPAALGTLTTIVALPESADRDRILALNRMADLHLRVEDVAAAKSALLQVAAGWDGTDAARFARQRIAHLPGAELLAEKREPSKIRIGTYEENLGLKAKPTERREPGLASPAQQVSDLLNRITRFPEDWETREQLAILYARHFKRYDLAKEQLEVLIAGPNQPDKAVAHWLNLLADLQLAAPDGIGQARETLGRIAERFPGTIWAETATSRIGRLSIENKGREGPVKTLKLGNYEQNIGLKPASGETSPPADAS